MVDLIFRHVDTVWVVTLLILSVASSRVAYYLATAWQQTGFQSVEQWFIVWASVICFLVASCFSLHMELRRIHGTGFTAKKYVAKFVAITVVVANAVGAILGVMRDGV